MIIGRPQSRLWACGPDPGWRQTAICRVTNFPRLQMRVDGQHRIPELRTQFVRPDAARRRLDAHGSEKPVVRLIDRDQRLSRGDAGERGATGGATESCATHLGGTWPRRGHISSR